MSYVSKQDTNVRTLSVPTNMHSTVFSVHTVTQPLVSQAVLQL